MKSITIDKDMREKLPNLLLGVIQADVSVEASVAGLAEEMAQVADGVKDTMVNADLKELLPLKDGRAAYRLLGKDPTKYRISSEKLLRRAIKGQRMPEINSVVDVSNIVSMVSGHSVGTYDADKIGSDLIFTVGHEGESYQSLGSQVINIDALPIFKDEKGPFGSTTTDSARAIVDEGTVKIVMNIISFSGEKDLNDHMMFAEELLVKYCNAEAIIKQIIK